MTDNYKLDTYAILVELMMHYFDFPMAPNPKEGDYGLNAPVFDRITMLREEIDELETAALVGNKEQVLDAICDLQVVLSSVALTLGMGEVKEEAFCRVMQANMLKKKGKMNKRTLKHDLIKPEGWQPPNLKDLVL